MLLCVLGQATVKTCARFVHVCSRVCVCVCVCVRVRVCILVSALSCEFRKDFWDSPDGERRRADRPGAKCTKLAAEER